MGSLGIDKLGRCLDDSLKEDENCGFPISATVQKAMKDNRMFLGRTVRNAATVSLKSEKLRKNFDETTCKLFYRAVL